MKTKLLDTNNILNKFLHKHF